MSDNSSTRKQGNHHCKTCGGTGKITCHSCHGEKIKTCAQCLGTGQHRCHHCKGSGIEICGHCEGTGKEYRICPTCSYGKVTKTRLVKCNQCAGTGNDLYFNELAMRAGARRRCNKCDGRGQVEEEYEEICPNCHGDYHIRTDAMCPRCGGTGVVECEECNGQKIVKCAECEGKGKKKCGHCHGRGHEECPECRRRHQIEKQKERERIETEQEKVREKARIAEERRDQRRGCGCLIFLAVLIGLLIWVTPKVYWWLIESRAVYELRLEEKGTK